MLITGYKIQHALRELEQSREIATQQFSDNILQFESQEDKLELIDVFAKFTSLEKKIARLQIVQTKYNLTVNVNILGENMSLHEAVKLVGGAGRAEKMWRTVVKGKQDRSNRFFSSESTRSKDTEYAKRSISVNDALAQSKFASKVASALRQAIQVGNATEIDLDIDQNLFES